MPPPPRRGALSGVKRLLHSPEPPTTRSMDSIVLKVLIMRRLQMPPLKQMTEKLWDENYEPLRKTSLNNALTDVIENKAELIDRLLIKIIVKHRVRVVTVHD